MNGIDSVRNDGTERDDNPIGRPTITTNLNHWKFLETEPAI